MRSGGRREAAALLVFGALALAGCGDQDSGGFADDPVYVDGLNDSVTAGSQPDWYTDDPDIDDAPAEPTPTEEPIPTETPTYEPPEQPELDRTDLDAHLAALTPADRALADHYLAHPLGEGTWIVASPMTVAEARDRLLGPDPELAKRGDFLSADSSAYAFLQVGDGVVAWEWMGFADPPKRLLAELSRDGAVSAVVTDNIEAMTRFGYARDGEIVFDDYEYAFVDSLDEIPAEVRDLARLAWDDLKGPMVETADWSSIGLAMAEKVTGVRATAEVQDVKGKANWYVVPMPWGAMEDY
jgi:hypothetical protein